MGSARSQGAPTTTTGQLIRHYRELAGLNQSELARRLHIKPQSVQEWEAGTTVPQARRMPDIARVLGVEPRDIAPGAPLVAPNGSARSFDRSPSTSLTVPSQGVSTFLTESRQDLPQDRDFRVTVQAQPVDGAVAIRALRRTQGTEPVVEMMVVSPAWAAKMVPGCNPNALRVVDILGDAMEPTLQAGTYALVDTDVETVDVDGIWVLMDVNSQYFIKRVQRRLDGSWLMLNDNKAYDPEIISPELQRRIQVKGRVRLGTQFVRF